MATLKEQREAAAAKANAIAEGAKAADRNLTPDEVASIRKYVEDIKGLDEQIKAANEAEDLLAHIGTSPEQKNLERSGDQGAQALAKSLGEHVLQHIGKELGGSKGARRTLNVPEWEGPAKAATDTHLTTTTGDGLLLPQYDFNFVRNFRRRLTVADWLGSGTLTSTAITYFTERPDSAIEGDFEFVGEGGAKPQLHLPAYDPVTETLKKIAGWIKISDEMTEDAAFLVSEIENRLMYQLMLFEEDALLSGVGSGTAINGLRNRVGVQTETAVDNTDNADALFRALTKIETATGLTADGIVINPVDYQKFRLSKDGNGQYFAGGIFTGQYGNGELMEQPPLWGQRTIVTPAMPAGKVLVGAGKQAATVYRKGGIRVEATNTHADDFTNNKITILAEERLTLAVRVPSAFCELTLSDVDPA